MAKIKHIISFDNTKISYRIKKGKKPYLVFVHGLGGNITGWNFQLKYFEKKGFSTLTPDLRGHGRSKIPTDKVFDFISFANDIELILKKEHIKEIILIGHCFGGIISQYLYSLNPKIVKKLILLNTGYSNPYKNSFFPLNNKEINIISNFYKYLLNFADKIGLTKYNYPILNCSKHAKYPTWYLMILSSIFYTNPKTFLNSQNSLMTFDSRKILKKIKVKTLIIAGNKDKFFPLNVLKSLNKKIKNSTLKIIEGKHLTILKEYDHVNELILDFIK
jgi:pimeloyl-ACP methyl ester carboxylesterase